MKYCKNCGKQMSDQSMFCPQCGARQQVQSQLQPQKKSNKSFLLAGIIIVVAVIAAAAIVVMGLGKKADNPKGSMKITETVEESSTVSESNAVNEAVEAESEETTLHVVGQTDLTGLLQANVKDTAESSKLENNSNGTSNSAMQAFDGKEETCWQEGVSGVGIGETMDVLLDRDYEIAYLTFKLGNWFKNDSHDDDYYFWGNSRPTTLTVTIGDVEHEVKFSTEKTEFIVEVKPAVTTDYLRFRIDEVDRSNIQWEDTAISEIGIYAEDDGLGWQKKDTGWSYYTEQDVPATGWLKWNGDWFFLDENGLMVTGWLEWENNWYYLKEDGTMMTGFWPITKIRIDSNYPDDVYKEYWFEGEGYYFLEDGRMHVGNVLVFCPWCDNLEKLRTEAQLNGMQCINDYYAYRDELAAGTWRVNLGYYSFSEDGTYKYIGDTSEK